MVKIYTQVQSTPNDLISVKSFLTLPSSVIKFSEINLPSTSILTKANLHENYFNVISLIEKENKYTNACY